MNEDEGFSDFRAKLRKLNKPQLGSFGEFVFVSTVRKIKETSIERFHDNRTDFLINRCPVDVKTTMRNIDKMFAVLIFMLVKEYLGLSTLRLNSSKH